MIYVVAKINKDGLLEVIEPFESLEEAINLFSKLSKAAIVKLVSINEYCELKYLADCIVGPDPDCWSKELYSDKICGGWAIDFCNKALKEQNPCMWLETDREKCERCIEEAIRSNEPAYIRCAEYIRKANTRAYDVEDI